MTVLDCTLRDGGYYNDWQFSREFINDYLKVMEVSRVDYVEIGLRIPVSSSSLGPVAYTTEGFLRSLQISKNIKLGVMINTKDFKDPETLKKFFLPQAESMVRLVRIASHFNEVDQSLEYADVLKSLGYVVGLNLMQIGCQIDTNIAQAAIKISKSKSIDVLYFADSLGNMGESDIENCVKLIRQHYKGELGIHAHNNKHKALTNTLFAKKLGVNWLDATVLGMGRGAGNTQTELLLTELNGSCAGNYLTEDLYYYVLGTFRELQLKYQWGPDLLYYLAADYKIHPTYIQELKGQGLTHPVELINAVESLKEVGSTTYKKLNLNEIIFSGKLGRFKNYNYPNINQSAGVLVIANGASIRAIAPEIKKLKQEKNFFIVSLNINDFISADCIDLIMMCNPARILSSIDSLDAFTSKLMMPADRLNDSLTNKLNHLSLLNYDLEICSKTYFESKGCGLTSPLVLSYALAFILSTGRRDIYLAGVDGYESDPDRNIELMKILQEFRGLSQGANFISLTPGHLGLPEESIFRRGLIYEI